MTINLVHRDGRVIASWNAHIEFDGATAEEALTKMGQYLDRISAEFMEAVRDGIETGYEGMPG